MLVTNFLAEGLMKWHSLASYWKVAFPDLFVRKGFVTGCRIGRSSPLVSISDPFFGRIITTLFISITQLFKSVNAPIGVLGRSVSLIPDLCGS